MIPGPTDVLVVVDMQNGFISPASQHVIPVVANLVRIWQDADAPVLMTRYINHPDSPYVHYLRWEKMQASPEIDIVDELQEFVGRTHLLDKTVYTTFTDQGRDLFDQQGWNTTYIVGLDTESCVAQTAVGAFETGRRPVVITDGCASHAGDEAHQAGMFVMSRNIGSSQLVTSADLSLATTVS